MSGTVASACDFCNCYLGLDPGYNKNTIGIRNSWKTTEWTSMVSAHRVAHGSDEVTTGSTLTESFVNTELFVKYSPITKLRLFLTVPYAINTLTYEGVSETGMAFSDMTLMGMYQLFNTLPHDSLGVRHRIFVGGGVKFPTGKSESDEEVDIPMSEDLYSGTGSTDYLFSLSYIGKYKKLGWNLDGSYKLNGESKNHYRYGNTFNLTPRIFYELGKKSVKLFPHIGAAYEMGVEDEYKDVTREETGGSVVCGSAGIDAYFGIFSVTTDFRLPIHHDMGAMMPEDQMQLFTSLNIHF